MSSWHPASPIVSAEYSFKMARKISQTIPFLILAVSLIHWATAQITTLQTIFYGAVFSAQDTCAQNCFTHYDAGCYMDNIGYSLQCPIQPEACTTNWGAPVNCYCRFDKQSDALALLSTCISSACTVGDVSIDLSSASSIYTAYCNAAVGVPPTVAATTTSSTPEATTTVYVTVTRSRALRLGATSASGCWLLPFILVFIFATSYTHYMYRSIEANRINHRASLPHSTSSPGSENRVTSASALSPTANLPSTIPQSTLGSSSAASTSTNSGQSSSDFWTKAGGIVSIVAIIVTSILSIVGLVYLIKQYNETRGRRHGEH